MSLNITYAIDFGTSNSLLAASVNGKTTQPIPLDKQHFDPSILRSLMYFPKKGNASFGTSAIDNYSLAEGEGRFLRSIKKYLPSETFTGTRINNKFYSIEELIARFLKEMKKRADQHFSQDVSSVVLGRPAKFSNEPQKDRLAQQRMQDAAQLAGFTNIEFFAEPLAAAFDYRRQINEEKIILIVDLGGGTSDFTVVRLKPDSYSQNDVLAIGGIFVAGDKLDGSIMSSLIAPHFGSDIEYKMPMSSNILKMPPELKIKLSSPADITLLSQSDMIRFLRDVERCHINKEDDIKMKQLFSLIRENLGFSIFEEIEQSKMRACSDGTSQFKFSACDIDINESYTYEEFLEFTNDKINDIFHCLDEVLNVAAIKENQVDLVCCTGGTSKVPAINETLINRFGVQKVQGYKNFHSVILGLAERASTLQ